MTFTIGMRTILREPAYYKQSLANLSRAGVFKSPQLVAFRFNNDATISPNANACAAIDKAASVEADWLIFMEDDLNVCDDFIGSLERWLTIYADPKYLVFPLGANYPRDIARCLVEGVSAWPYRTAAFYGSVAFVMRPDDAMRFADWLLAAGHPRSLDRWLAMWAEQQGCTQFLTPAPCFIDHIGRKSSLATKAGHFTGHYDGFVQEAWFPK